MHVRAFEDIYAEHVEAHTHSLSFSNTHTRTRRCCATCQKPVTTTMPRTCVDGVYYHEECYASMEEAFTKAKVQGKARYGITHLRICKRISASFCVRAHARLYVHVCACVCTCACEFAWTSTYSYAQTQTIGRYSSAVSRRVPEMISESPSPQKTPGGSQGYFDNSDWSPAPMQVRSKSHTP